MFARGRALYKVRTLVYNGIKKNDLSAPTDKPRIDVLVGQLTPLCIGIISCATLTFKSLSKIKGIFSKGTVGY